MPTLTIDITKKGHGRLGALPPDTLRRVITAAVASRVIPRGGWFFIEDIPAYFVNESHRDAFAVFAARVLGTVHVREYRQAPQTLTHPEPCGLEAVEPQISAKVPPWLLATPAPSFEDLSASYMLAEVSQILAAIQLATSGDIGRDEMANRIERVLAGAPSIATTN